MPERKDYGSGWLRAVVETAVDGIILIDSRGKVLMFNPACETLLSYAAGGDLEECQGAHARSFGATRGEW